MDQNLSNSVNSSGPSIQMCTEQRMRLQSNNIALWIWQTSSVIDSIKSFEQSAQYMAWFQFQINLQAIYSPIISL